MKLSKQIELDFPTWAISKYPVLMMQDDGKQNQFAVSPCSFMLAALGLLVMSQCEHKSHQNQASFFSPWSTRNKPNYRCLTTLSLIMSV